MKKIIILIILCTTFLFVFSGCTTLKLRNNDTVNLNETDYIIRSNKIKTECLNTLSSHLSSAPDTVDEKFPTYDELINIENSHNIIQKNIDLLKSYSTPQSSDFNKLSLISALNQSLDILNNLKKMVQEKDLIMINYTVDLLKGNIRNIVSII